MNKEPGGDMGIVIIPSGVERYSQVAQAVCWTLLCIATVALTVKIGLQIAQEGK